MNYDAISIMTILVNFVKCSYMHSDAPEQTQYLPFVMFAGAHGFRVQVCADRQRLHNDVLLFVRFHMRMRRVTLARTWSCSIWFGGWLGTKLGGERPAGTLSMPLWRVRLLYNMCASLHTLHSGKSGD